MPIVSVAFGECAGEFSYDIDERFYLEVELRNGQLLRVDNPTLAGLQKLMPLAYCFGEK